MKLNVEKLILILGIISIGIGAYIDSIYPFYVGAGLLGIYWEWGNDE